MGFFSFFFPNLVIYVRIEAYPVEESNHAACSSKLWRYPVGLLIYSHKVPSFAVHLPYSVV